MSGKTDVRRYHPTRRQWLLALFAGILIAGLVAVATTVGTSAPANDTASAQSYETARHAYEAALLKAPDRIDSDFGAYVDDKTSTVYTAYAWMGDCTVRCMTVRKVNGGYALTLPVGYSYSPGSQNFEAPFVKNAVTSLTYWDPSEHAARTVVSQDGASVKLPTVLYSRSVDSVRVGETVYVTPDWIRNAHGNTIVLKGVYVQSEPSNAYYGSVDLARLTRTQAGFDACLPSGYHAPISDPNAAGTTVTIASKPC